MTIDLIWDDTVPNLVHYRFNEGWTWEDFRQAALTEHTWGEALNGVRYDIIGDLTHASIPRGTAFSNILRLFKQGPKNRILIVAIGSPLAHSMIQVAGRIYPQVKERFHYADTLTDARRFIMERRSDAATVV